ncbi:hypothetical protein [Spirosoma flavum]|uniref:Uncharacterized protein n=1 Tax=Spirosoma flavum TaxID=2048557 RepID=A0ABW6ATA6_9BACT
MDTEALFDQFKAFHKTQSLSDSQNHFIKDGVNNPDLFGKQKTKILFIAKEHNYIGLPDDQSYACDYRVWSKQGIYLRFAHRLSEWAYGLMNNFPPYEQLTNKNKHEALQSITFINVKKASGSASANPEHIC